MPQMNKIVCIHCIFTLSMLEDAVWMSYMPDCQSSTASCTEPNLTALWKSTISLTPESILM